MEIIRKLTFRRFLLLTLSLIAGLSVGVYEFLKGELPSAGFGIILLLLMTAFLTGISLILRSTARQMRRHLVDATPDSSPGHSKETLSVFTLLRNKPR